MERFSIALHEKDGKAAFESTKSRLAKRAQPVSGIGDDAYASVMGSAASLVILKGDSTIGLALIGVPDGLPKVEQLARKALSRLQ